MTKIRGYLYIMSPGKGGQSNAIDCWQREWEAPKSYVKQPQNNTIYLTLMMTYNNFNNLSKHHSEVKMPATELLKRELMLKSACWERSDDCDIYEHDDNDGDDEDDDIDDEDVAKICLLGKV